MTEARASCTFCNGTGVRFFSACTFCAGTGKKDVVSKDGVSNIFKRFDANNDGFIDKDELLSVLQILDADLCSDTGMKHIFSVVDVNEDGKISYQELLDWLWNTTDSLDFEKATVSLQKEPDVNKYEVEVKFTSGELLDRREFAEINAVKCIKNAMQSATRLPSHTRIAKLVNAAGEDIDETYGERSLADTFRKGETVTLTAIIEDRRMVGKPEPAKSAAAAAAAGADTHGDIKGALEIDRRLNPITLVEDACELYKWRQQAMEGDNDEDRPEAENSQQIIEEQKWQAWESVRGTSQEQAKEKYRQTVMKMQKKYGEKVDKSKPVAKPADAGSDFDFDFEGKRW